MLIAVLCLWAGTGCVPRLSAQRRMALWDDPILSKNLLIRQESLPSIHMVIQDLRSAGSPISIGQRGSSGKQVMVYAPDDETPPSVVLLKELLAEFSSRGVDQVTYPNLELFCQLSKLLIRYQEGDREQAPVDAWGYLDLNCELRDGPTILFSGTVHGRYRDVVETLAWSKRTKLEKNIWPQILGPLVQQVATILGRSLPPTRDLEKKLAMGQRWLESTDPQMRSRAAYSLGILGDIRALPWLIYRMDDTDDRVHRSVLDALGLLGEEKLLPELLSRFAKENAAGQWLIVKSILQNRVPSGFAWLQGHRPSILESSVAEAADDVLQYNVRSTADGTRPQ